MDHQTHHQSHDNVHGHDTRVVTPSPSMHSLVSDTTASASGPRTPVHPVASMRGAFAESILDQDFIPSTPVDPNAPNSRPRPRYHRLRKLVAQLAFGLYLLHKRLAKSDAEVVRIVQGHVSDMEVFLSTTGNAFDLAISDIGARTRALKVALQAAPDVLEKLLHTRSFRRQMVDRNERIAFVVLQTTTAMNAALDDIREGLAAVDELAKYLLDLRRPRRSTAGGGDRDGQTPPPPSASLLRVYSAIAANVEAWFARFLELKGRAKALARELTACARVLHEMERRTGVASRKHKVSIIRLCE